MRCKQINLLSAVFILSVLVLGLALIFKPALLHATMYEQLAIDPRAMALGNAVTADPPGIMSIHYNPAGLSNITENSLTCMSIAGLGISNKVSLTTNPEWENFLLGDYHDPLADTSGWITDFVVHIPGYGDKVMLPANVVLPISGGISLRSPGSKWTFAMGTYAPMIGGFGYSGEDNPLRYDVSTLYWQHLLISPSVSYKATPTMSFGLSVGLGISAMGISTEIRLPNQLVALTKILGTSTEGLSIPPFTSLTLPAPWFEGGIDPYQSAAFLDFSGEDNFVPTFNLGFLWDPYDWFSFGIVYHSEIKGKLNGTYSITYEEDFMNMIRWLGSSPVLITAASILGLPSNPVASQSGIMSTDMTMPRNIQSGIKVKPFKFLTLLFDMNWAQWSTFKENRIVFDQDIQAFQLATILGYQGGAQNFVLTRNLQDTLNFGFGLEITPRDWLTFRFGYEQRRSSVAHTKNFDPIFNFPDWNVYSTGIGIKFKNGLTIDLSASYLSSDVKKVKVNENNLMNNTDFTKVIYNPFAGLDYEQNFDIYVVGLKFSAPTSLFNETAGAIFDSIANLF